jgi:hypothetical protein
MTNETHKFKHRDVVRVIKAALAAGINIDRVTVDPHTGEITVAASSGKAAVMAANGTMSADTENIIDKL